MNHLRESLPCILVVLLSLVTGLVAVLIFRFTSDQKEIRRTKDILQANLLALRLFQDQISVVLRAYRRILLATGRYLGLTLLPALLTVVPLILILPQLDRYLGSMPLRPGQSFLVQAQVANPEALSQTSLQLPSGLRATAPALHMPGEDTVVWRVEAEKEGSYRVNVQTAGQTFAKQVVVGTGLPRLSSLRLREGFWERFFLSGEPPLPRNAGVRSITVTYPERKIPFATFAWNWIYLLAVLSLITGYGLKMMLGIEI